MNACAIVGIQDEYEVWEEASSATIADISEVDPPHLYRPIRQRLVHAAPTDTALLTVESLSLNNPTLWLDRLLDSLQSMKSLRAGWTIGDVEPPNDTALALARYFLVELANSEIPLQPILVEPSSDAGACIVFWNGHRYADIECFNDGDVLASTHLRGIEPPNIWSVQEANAEETINTIRSFLAG